MKGLVNRLGDAATRFGHKAVFKLKKASPELLLVGGIVCIVGGTVLACKATKKADKILDEGREDVKLIEGNINKANDADEEVRFKEAIKKGVVRAKLHTLGRVAGAYAPAVALGSAGIAMIFTSHGIMRKRNGALLASYNALDAMFKTYRARVLEEEDGKERDRRYLLGNDILKWPDDGQNESEAVRNVNDEAAEMLSQYPAWYDIHTVRFDENTSSAFSMHPFSNLQRIRGAEGIMTSRLHEKGYVSLNEVLHELHMDPVPWGQLLGRIWYPGEENDDFVIEAVEVNPDQPGSPIILNFELDKTTIWDKL